MAYIAFFPDHRDRPHKQSGTSPFGARTFAKSSDMQDNQQTWRAPQARQRHAADNPQPPPARPAATQL